jgi:peptidoglycan/xylan/chitin deacetylase (PgdA/CDA1 family)
MRVALTVDTEHPDRPTTDPIGNFVRTLDVLEALRVKATFFVQGTWARAYPDLVHRIAAGGHLVGGHSHRHCPYTSLHAQGIAHDLQSSRHSLAVLGLDVGGWFRLPGGRGSGDAAVLEALRSSGFRHVGWTAMAGDWRPDRSVAQVVDKVLADVDGRRPDGLSVPVFHSWPDSAPPALEMVLEKLDGSVQFVTLDQVDPTEVPRD